MSCTRYIVPSSYLLRGRQAQYLSKRLPSWHVCRRLLGLVWRWLFFHGTVGCRSRSSQPWFGRRADTRCRMKATSPMWEGKSNVIALRSVEETSSKPPPLSLLHYEWEENTTKFHPTDDSFRAALGREFLSEISLPANPASSFFHCSSSIELSSAHSIRNEFANKILPSSRVSCQIHIADFVPTLSWEWTVTRNGRHSILLQDINSKQ